MPRVPLPGGLGLMEITSNDGFFGASVWDSSGVTTNAKAVQNNTTFPVCFMGCAPDLIIDTAPPFSVATILLEFAAMGSVLITGAQWNRSCDYAGPGPRWLDPLRDDARSEPFARVGARLCGSLSLGRCTLSMTITSSGVIFVGFSLKPNCSSMAMKSETRSSAASLVDCDVNASSAHF